MKCNAIEKPLMQEISIEQIFNLDLPLTNEKDGAVFAHKFKGDLLAKRRLSSKSGLSRYSTRCIVGLINA